MLKRQLQINELQAADGTCTVQYVYSEYNDTGKQTHSNTIKPSEGDTFDGALSSLGVVLTEDADTANA
jgi:hypothetical protein